MPSVGAKMTYTFASATILLMLITDPFGNIPIFASALRHVPAARRPWVILREVLIAFGLLLTFMFIGDGFLRLMNLSRPVAADRWRRDAVSDRAAHDLPAAARRSRSSPRASR